MRRIHLQALTKGTVPLAGDQAHHLRDVLRLKAGETVQAFDDAGNTAEAKITEISETGVKLLIQSITPPDNHFQLTIASAIPKAARADWMIEKLSELGVNRFIPLKSQRSVVLPKGEGKLDRWTRIATESAKQSRRQGVMRIEILTKLPDLLEQSKDQTRWHLSTNPNAASMVELAANLPASLLLMIGPEGGWTDEETQSFAECNVVAAHLTDTILRIETATIAAAAVVASITAKSNT